MIEELNDQIRRCNSKIEEHLDGRSAALAATSNVTITLATALGAGIGILLRDTAGRSISEPFSTLLVMAAASTLLSLFLGVLALVSRSGISRRGVMMWVVSREQMTEILAAGSGDEAVTQNAYELALPDISRQLSEHAKSYEDGFERMANLVSWQAAALSVGVLAALVATFIAYL